MSVTEVIDIHVIKFLAAYLIIALATINSRSFVTYYEIIITVSTLYTRHFQHFKECPLDAVSELSLLDRVKRTGKSRLIYTGQFNCIIGVVDLYGNFIAKLGHMNFI